MAETCYRHPDRETRVSCSSCGRSICPECMTPTPVGMRCPECASQRTRVVRNPTGTPGGFEAASFIHLLEVPARLDRAEGDIHGQGNPHVQTSPANILAVAKPLAHSIMDDIFGFIFF